MTMTHFRDDVRIAYKFVSIRLLAIGTAMQTAWLFLPDSLKDKFPEHFGAWIAYFIFFTTAYGVLYKQKNLPSAPLAKPTVPEPYESH
jgi:hypothetical protein